MVTWRATARILWLWRCPLCLGQGGWHEDINCDFRGPYYTCQICKGIGQVSLNFRVRWYWWESLCPIWLIEGLEHFHAWRHSE